MGFERNYFGLSSSGEIVETRCTEGKHPSELTFPYNLINNTSLSSLAYAIVSVNNRVTYIANEVLVSRHNCVMDECASYLNMPKRLANFKIYTKYCSAHPYKRIPWHLLYCTKKSHRCFWETRCDCKLCVKNGTASLKSQCVNKLEYVLAGTPATS